MNCDFAEEQILTAFDGPLAEVDRRALEEHVVGCESCSKFRAMQLAADDVFASNFAGVVADEFLVERIGEKASGPLLSRIPAWLPDALNAAGVAAMVAAVGVAGATGTVVFLGVLGLLGLVCYPLVLVRTE